MFIAGRDTQISLSPRGAACGSVKREKPSANLRQYTRIKTKFNARTQNLVGRFSKIDDLAVEM